MRFYVQFDVTWYEWGLGTQLCFAFAAESHRLAWVRVAAAVVEATKTKMSSISLKNGMAQVCNGHSKWLSIHMTSVPAWKLK